MVEFIVITAPYTRKTHESGGNMKKSAYLIFALLIISGMLTACSGNTSSPDADISQSAPGSAESAELSTDTESSFPDKRSTGSTSSAGERAESSSTDGQSEDSLTPPSDLAPEGDDGENGIDGWYDWYHDRDNEKTSSSDESASPAEDFFYRSYGETVTITSYIGKGGNVVVPSEINGKKVTAISGKAFFKNSSITGVVIPETVKEFDYMNFSNCENLASVDIRAKITEIPETAFYNCTALSTVLLPDTVTVIGERAFMNCESIESFILPDSVKEIKAYAFSDCENLKAVPYSESLERIDEGAFDMCMSLTEAEIPESVKEIGNRAFDHCPKLKRVILPEGLEKIGDNAFCISVDIDEIALPESIREIGSFAFGSSIMIKSLKIPDGIEKIAADSFYSGGLLGNVEYNGKSYSSYSDFYKAFSEQ